MPEKTLSDIHRETGLGRDAIDALILSHEIRVERTRWAVWVRGDDLERLVRLIMLVQAKREARRRHARPVSAGVCA